MAGMTELWVERTGVRQYVGRSSRGAQVLVGNEDVDGVFTPGELLKIALAACSGMASDAPLRRRLGDDYTTTIRVSGPADRDLLAPGEPAAFVAHGSELRGDAAVVVGPDRGPHAVSIC